MTYSFLSARYRAEDTVVLLVLLCAAVSGGYAAYVHPADPIGLAEAWRQ